MRPGPSSWPRPDCTTQPPSRCPNGTNPGRTYKFYVDTPVVPFGFGLSYTTFTYSIAQFPTTTVSLAPVVAALAKAKAAGRLFPTLSSLAPYLTKYEVKITNTGKYDADDVVLGFLVPPGAGVNGVPLKYLFGFERVHVPRGQTVSAFFYPSLGDFALADSKGNRQALAGEYTVQFGIPETEKSGQGFAVHKLQTAL